ncbi:hypothetical protein JBE04_00990 [Streptomyces sp. PRKS01-29]|nr:hypothetical protein [Streptomyces sabulosicollis]MBI0293106.1 hypothetical protein [Streptomyces sabulosicollis]
MPVVAVPRPVTHGSTEPTGGCAVVFSTSTSAQPSPAGPVHMVVCGDDALAHRLAAELHDVAPRGPGPRGGAVSGMR